MPEEETGGTALLLSQIAAAIKASGLPFEASDVSEWSEWEYPTVEVKDAESGDCLVIYKTERDIKRPGILGIAPYPQNMRRAVVWQIGRWWNYTEYGYSFSDVRDIPEAVHILPAQAASDAVCRLLAGRILVPIAEIAG